MSKASMDNQRVKNQITEGLFSLLRKKSFSEITVTDIVKEANVARASYYRNFQNKEGSLIQQTFNRYIMEFAGNMPAGSATRYKLYFISGAVTNVLIEWLNEGAKEPPREIAALCVNYFSGGILHK